MACINTICPFNSGTKCANNLTLCIVRDLYNAQQRTYACLTYSTQEKVK